MMPRFFVPADWLARDPVVLTGPLAHQLGRVLRLAPGARVQLLDGTGSAYEAELVSLAGERVTARVLRQWAPATEARTRLVLYQALTRAERWEWVLQKGAELGVARFVPLEAERALVHLASVDERKLARWRAILQEAAEQSGRARLPELSAPQTVAAAVAAWPGEGPLLMAALVEGAVPLRQALGGAPLAAVGLMIGPEGDFTPDEVAAARAGGATIVSLGARVLRTETAPLAALAAILYAAGEM